VKRFNIIVTDPLVCFKEGTKILTNMGYVNIERLKLGNLLKTIHGYKPIYAIGKKIINHIAVPKRIENQLYKCSSLRYPVFEDLILTGSHSILVDKKCEGVLVSTTENKYRLPAYLDSNSIVYEHSGKYTIYHVALENESEYTNYGIYANGLLVESCSKDVIKKNMELPYNSTEYKITNLNKIIMA
jgi:hypothetical protein